MNSRNRKFKGSGKGPPTGHIGPKHEVGPIRTRNWAGPPGPTQKGDRSNGVKRVKTSMKTVGV